MCLGEREHIAHLACHATRHVGAARAAQAALDFIPIVWSNFFEDAILSGARVIALIHAVGFASEQDALRMQFAHKKSKYLLRANDGAAALCIKRHIAHDKRHNAAR